MASTGAADCLIVMNTDRRRRRLRHRARAELQDREQRHRRATAAPGSRRCERDRAQPDRRQRRRRHPRVRRRHDPAERAQRKHRLGISDGAPPGPAPPATAPARPGEHQRTTRSATRSAGHTGAARHRLPSRLIASNTVSGNFGERHRVRRRVRGERKLGEPQQPGSRPAAGGVTVAAGSTCIGNAISFNIGFGLMLPAPADRELHGQHDHGQGTLLGAGRT